MERGTSNSPPGRRERLAAHGSDGPDRLSREDEQALLRQYAQRPSPETLETLVAAFTPYARSFAVRYRSSNEDLEDLYQVAMLGLVNAVERFRPDQGEFKSFAAATILGELRHHLRDRVSQVRLPRSLQDRILRIDAMSTDLSEQLGRAPTAKEVASAADLNLESVVEALEAKEARRQKSLDVSVGEDGSATRVDLLPVLEDGFDRIEASMCANTAGLTRRERRILKLYYGRGMSQAEIGQLIGISQMQVSRVSRGAIQKLLESMRTEEAMLAERGAHASAAAG